MEYRSRSAVQPVSGIALNAFIIALLLALSVGALAATVRFGAMPTDPARGIAVVYSPWTSSSVALEQSSDAGARFVRFGGLSFITVMMPDDDGYAGRVVHRGAWFTLDPAFLDACFRTRITTTALQ